MTKPDPFLDQLASGLEPVQVKRLPGMAAFTLLAGLSVCAIAIYSLGWIDPHAAEGFSRISLLSAFILSLVLGALLVVSASISAVPGRRLSSGMKLALGMSGTLLVGGLILISIQERFLSLSAGCVTPVVLIAVPATVLLFFQLRKMAPVRPAQTGVLAGLGWGVIAGGLMLAACPDASASHMLLWHYLVPAGGFSAFAALVARRFLRW